MSLFRRRNYRPHDWIIYNAQEPLVRLSFTGFSDFWECYVVGYLAITAADMEAAELRDPRDVPWEFVDCETGQRVPFCAFSLSWKPTERGVSLKYYGSYPTTRSDRWTRLKALMGSPPPRVPQERAPLGWHKLRKRRILRQLRHSDLEDVLGALDCVRYYASQSQAPWASDLFRSYAIHESDYAREIAIRGFGELARVHGYVDVDRVPAILVQSSTDPSAAVRQAAERTLSEIRRFTNILQP
jgi:hypothetical protein